MEPAPAVVTPRDPLRVISTGDRGALDHARAAVARAAVARAAV
ncbi:hypothetical protein ACH492_01120 [Streptomyces sp. NPDC019443]